MIQISWGVLDLDCENETKRIVARLKEVVMNRFRRRGGVVALSGGVDSSRYRSSLRKGSWTRQVFGLLMPDQDSSTDTGRLSRHVAETLGIEHHLEDITAILEAEGCYSRRDEAIKKCFRSIVRDL